MNVDDIVSSMTLEEKCVCLTGEGYWMLGGVSRLGVLPLIVADGPHGLRKQTGAADNLGLSQSEPAISFPTASASACTFNVDLMRMLGEALGDEARSQGVAVVLGPGVNMKRNPLCGRNFEYFSEDPYLSGELAAAYIQGVQSRGVGASLKHFVCNNQETNRLIIDSVVDSRALHELYLEPFRIAVEKAQPWTIMTAYNLLNGTYCSEDPWLMEEVARKSWGFKGAFVTDWGAQNSNFDSLPAGLDLVMPGPRLDYREDVAKAVQAGSIAQADLDGAVHRVLQLHAKQDRAKEVGIKLDISARLEVAREVAEEAAVLLENDGVLPLSGNVRLALVGAFTRHPRYQGAGSSKINPLSLDCAYDELAAAGVDFTYASGYDVLTGATSEDLLDEAARIAEASDVVVVFVGLPDASETEGADRVSMELPLGHNLLVERLCATGKRVVAVLQGGSPVELPWRKKVNALLLSYLAGCRSGIATVNLLLGKANPSGKLAETWPLCLADTPCAQDFPAKGRQARYVESIFTGYRYADAANIEPAYPFGFGLSYTTFSYHDLRVDAVEQDFVVSFTVENTGLTTGKEVAQLYVAPIDSGVFKAPQQLKGFCKVELAPGQKQRITCQLSRRDFAHFDTRAQRWDVEGGSYEIRIGASSRDVRLCITVEVFGCEKRDGSAPVIYHQVKPGGFTQKDFAELYSKPFPKMIVPMRPYTPNATLGDLKKSFLGLVVHYFIRRQLKLLSPQNSDKHHLVLALASDVPLRSLAMSGADMNLVYGIVDILNYHFIRAFNRFRKLKISSKNTVEAHCGEDAA